MAPPPKRQKRNVIPSSSTDSDEAYVPPPAVRTTRSRLGNLVSSSPPPSDDTPLKLPDRTAEFESKRSTKPQPRPKPSNYPPNAAPLYPPSARASKAVSKSVSNSPEKRKRKSKIEDKGKNADIFTFFTKQAQRQQQTGSNQSSTEPRGSVHLTSAALKTEEFDGISDESEDDVGERQAQRVSTIGAAVRKRAKGAQMLKNHRVEVPISSQKFVRPSLLVEEERIAEDLRPWAEKFAPTNLDELAVHKKKVADVRVWLEAVMGGRMRQRLLILKGAAGTGKTMTIQLLAETLDCDVLEWRNPVGSLATADGVQSMAAQFEEFMGRGGKFGQLDLTSGGNVMPLKAEVKPLDRRKRLILIEEFPNTFTRSSTALQSFRSTIIQYLAANTPPLSAMYNPTSIEECITPVVMVISETLLTTTSASADSFTAHRLLGPEILQHPGVFSIEFNAIAPTLIAKALDVIIQKESKKSGRKKTPGPLVLKKLGEIGDIRSAIGSLEFLCLRGDTDGDWGAKVTFGKTKRITKEPVALTKMEEESLELVTRREASLGIFHAVGKVVYNKREDQISQSLAGQNVEQLPDFMSTNSRPRRSQVSVDALIDETGTDTPTFVATLHENYLMSCEAPANSYEFSSIDHVNGCIDALSDSDLLCPDWNGSLNPTGFGGGTGGRGSGGDILRQDEISFQIAVRGLLFSLPYPVKRMTPAAAGLRTGRGGDAFKMFYPTSLKLWRTKEEIESTIDLWVTKLMKGEDSSLGSITSGAAAFAKPKSGIVESWKNRNTVSHVVENTGHGSDVENSVLMSSGTSARKEMLLERLPYMVLIARARKSTSSVLAVRDMEKVTTFRGIGAPSEESPDDNDDTVALGEEWATDRPSEGSSPKKKKLAIRGGPHMASGIVPSQPEEKFVLSDDDIEDD
ncbi:Rad17 cell cycle checkpoint protein [Phlyctema vagabunda]|uniref:Rad17 cell cycle checkpoint protein n=1 Tax=Phlyctema vagabunda TaxID=108571 RepID=A0ABR4PW05_9HELO